MAIHELRTEEYWVTADDIEQARDRLLKQLVDNESYPDCVFEDEPAAQSKAWDARRYDFSSGKNVYAFTLSGKTVR